MSNTEVPPLKGPLGIIKSCLTPLLKLLIDRVDESLDDELIRKSWVRLLNWHLADER